MERREPVLLSWSGGKDSALALYEVEKSVKYRTRGLLTTITQGYDRVSMHGVRRALLKQQAQAVGLPLMEIFISNNATNEEYESKMWEALNGYKVNGVSSVAFGDIFLEGVRRYREENLSKLGMKGVFPLWRRDTGELAKTFLQLGFKGYVTCVDSRVLERTFAGRMIDDQFLAQLPGGVDPCGENGEFHTFVYDGPIFKERVSCTLGEVIFRDPFYFCDLLPG